MSIKFFFFKLKTVAGENNIFFLSVLFFLLILSSILETITIGSVPILVNLIINPDFFILKFGNYFNYFNYFSSLSKQEVIILFCIILIIFFIIKFLLSFFIIYFQLYVIKKIKTELLKKIFDYYISAPYKIFLRTNSSILIRTLTIDVGNSTIRILHFINLIKESFVLIAIFLLLIYVEPLISSSLFLFFFILTASYFFITKRRLHKRGEVIQVLSTNIIKNIHDIIGSIKEIKIFNIENFFKFFFHKNVVSNENYFLKNSIIMAMPRVLLEMISAVGIILLIFFYLTINKELMSLIPFLSLIVISTIRLMPVFSNISNALSYSRITKSSFDHIFYQISSLRNNYDIQNIKKEVINFRNEIRLENIFFSYESNNNKDIINNLSLKISCKDKVGIIGKSGTGKTTLVNIILGLIKPIKGNVFIDNKSIDFDKFQWAHTIGYVPQEVYLLNETIERNIALGISDSEINYKRLEEVVKIAQIYDYILSLPDKFRTLVGEKGNSLSVGQKQRIGIARALYRNPNILILDESTSALDSVTENNFINDVFNNNSDKTIVSISHNMNALKKCSKIFDVDKNSFI
jgi:ATP-binding cassette subfamily C protein